MNKIILSTMAALTLGTAIHAETMTIYTNKATGEIFNTPGEGRTKLGEYTKNAAVEPTPKTKITEVEQSSSNSEGSVLNRFHFKGDLRLRYESKEYNYDDGYEKTPTYHNRYRLRLVSAIDLTDRLTFDAGMRSGYANPTSGNQTFEDRALSDYFWQSLRVNILGLTYQDGDHTLKVGREPYMLYRPLKSQLVWDNDLSFDGINYKYENDSRIINLGVNQPTYAEDSVARDTINLVVAQYVEKIKLENSHLNLGAGVYYYDGVKGNTPLYSANNNKGMGNTLVNGVFENDYNIVEAFGELKFKDVFGKPVALAAGAAYNTQASNNNFGYDLAVQIGKAKNVHDWQVKYSYTDTQEDAVLGAHSDSDNFGGGTAAKGHAIRTKYKFGKHTDLAATFFYNKLYANRDGSSHSEAYYERVQLDVILKF